MTATFNLLDTNGNVLRTVRGAGTAVMLRNAGECASFEATERITWQHIEKAKEYAADLNEMFAMGEPVADTTNIVAGVVVNGEVFPVDPPLPNEGTTAYDGVSLAALRKMASQAGMRTSRGIDPYKQATRDQLIDFLNGGAH